MHITLVAGVAGQLLVFSAQFKLGIAVMREAAITPAFRIVAAVTLIAVFALMHIV